MAENTALHDAPQQKTAGDHGREIGDITAEAARGLPMMEALEHYGVVAAELDGYTEMANAWQARMCQRDLFYLLLCVLNRVDVLRPWLYARVREWEGARDGHIDLWARGHYKSTVITYAGTIQDILASHGDHPIPEWMGIEPTFGIFSHTRPIAKKFLRQIKQELEINAALKALFPDILYPNPGRDAEKWSEESGITVRRQSNPKEATVEAWGLVDGQPTGAHYYVRLYDDVVTRESVTTPEMIGKTTEAWELSINLGMPGGRERYIGTRYAMMDTYSAIMERGGVKPRIYPGTDNGTESGNPVLVSVEEMKKLRRTMGPVTFAAQILQKPISKATATFDVEHLKFAEIRPRTMNVYILCDPAHSKRRGSDRTAMAVIGYDSRRNCYLLDGFNHKMNLTERWKALKGLRKRWMREPGVQTVRVGYERYGLQADIEHFQGEMERDKEAFEIVELAWPREGPGAKGDRIGRLRPSFEGGHFFLPILVWHDSMGLAYLRVEDGEVKYVDARAEGETALMRKVANAGNKFLILRPIKRADEEGRIYDVTIRLIVEYLAHPAPGAHDDLIDAVSRIHDIEPSPPVIIHESELEPETGFVDA